MVTLNGAHGQFVEDPGAGGTMVHSGWLEKFSLDRPQGEGEASSGAGGGFTAFRANLRSFAIEGVALDIDQVRTLDLGAAVETKWVLSWPVLAHLDEMAVGIDDVTPPFVAIGQRRGQEFSTPCRPFTIDGVDIGDAHVHEGGHGSVRRGRRQGNGWLIGRSPAAGVHDDPDVGKTDDSRVSGPRDRRSKDIAVKAR